MYVMLWWIVENRAPTHLAASLERFDDIVGNAYGSGTICVKKHRRAGQLLHTFHT